MEKPNVTQIPIIRRVPANDAANDIHVGPIIWRTPDDIIKDADARASAGLAPDHHCALPEPGEAINVLIAGNCGYAPAMHGTIKAAHCKLALDANRILVDFAYVEGDPGTKSAWVTLSQITFPKRNAECGVV